MSQRRIRLSERAGELNTYRIAGVFKDEANAPIPSSALGSLKLTLFNADDATIINGVDQVQILNAGRGSVDAGANLICTLLPQDNVIVGNAIEELHVAFFDWEWASGAKRGSVEVEFFVRNFVKAG